MLQLDSPMISYLCLIAICNSFSWWDVSPQKRLASALTFQGHSRSNMVQLDSPYRTSCLVLDSNVFPNSTLLWDILHQICTTLALTFPVDLPSLPKFKSNSTVGFTLYYFLLVFICNICPDCSFTRQEASKNSDWISSFKVTTKVKCNGALNSVNIILLVFNDMM